MYENKEQKGIEQRDQRWENSNQNLHEVFKFHELEQRKHLK